MRLFIVAMLAASAAAQGVVEGVVSNAVTGAPVAGVQVDVNRSSGLAIRPVKTDAQGAYRLESVASGAQTVTFTKEGFGVARERAAVGASTLRLDIRLMPNATVSGRVLGPGGKPVRNAAVQL